MAAQTRKNKNNKNHGSWPHLIPDPLNQLASAPTNSWKVRSQRCTQRQAKQSPERRFIWKTWSSKEVETSTAKNRAASRRTVNWKFALENWNCFNMFNSNNRQYQHFFNIRHKEVFWEWHLSIKAISPLKLMRPIWRLGTSGFPPRLHNTQL